MQLKEKHENEENAGEEEGSIGKGKLSYCPTSYVPTLREKQRRHREDAILAAAQALIAAIGYDAMTMEDLADRAGISKPTLYQHFPSKEAIVLRAVVRLMENSVAFVHSLDPALPAIERLELLVRRVIERRFISGTASFGTARTALIPVIKAQPEYQNVYRALVGTTEKMVEEASAAGDIAPTLNPRLLVQIVFSLVRDGEYEELLASGECSAEELADTLVAVYFGGVRRNHEPNVV